MAGAIAGNTDPVGTWPWRSATRQAASSGRCSGRDGKAKTAIQILVEEAAAGAFIHFVGDRLFVSDTAGRCVEQLVSAAQAEACSVSAVQPTREHVLPYFGTVGGKRVAGRPGLYEIETVLEKPTPTQAKQELIVPGLRAGHYLCFFGMHAFTPTVFDVLEALGPQGDRQLSPALALLAGRERYLALEIAGRRYNLGLTYGLLTAQLTLGLAGKDRGEILALMVELLARQAG